MKLLRKFKWRGRRYLGGLIHGFGSGVCIGFFIALKLGWKLPPAFLIYFFIGVLFVSILGHFVLGKAPEEKDKILNIK